MTTVTVEQAQAGLADLIEQAQPGQEILITRGDRPVARLTVEAPAKRQPRRPGNCRGMLTIVADDEEHLKDFAEYVE
jgi:antitoxin (DNA-binding transcriptional repressor) of toxin-antitoxin stability system